MNKMYIIIGSLLGVILLVLIVAYLTHGSGAAKAEPETEAEAPNPLATKLSNS